MSPRVLSQVAVAASVGFFVLGCQAAEPSASPSEPASEPTSTDATVPVDAPAECVKTRDATRTSTEGEPAWARFCPGPDGLTAPAEIPSDVLTSHLDLLDGLTDGAGGEPEYECRATSSRTYRLQIGYADGSVGQVKGQTGPECVGKLGARGSFVHGPDGLGVYGVVMAAFGQQYADRFDPTPAEAPLVCPDDPRDPDSVDLDGASTSLETGIRNGRPEPMVMPLTAVRGVLCTWEHDGDEPTSVELSPEDAERVRIGMHAIYGAMVDCAASPDPTYTAVVEDKTGTRRAVTIIESECSTVIRSDDGYGLGFPWLDR